MKFRFGYSSRSHHPCIIVKKRKRNFSVISITTHPDSRHKYEEFKVNPNKYLDRKQYWSKRIQMHNDSNLMDLKKWKLSRKDKKEIKYFVKSKHFN